MPQKIALLIDDNAIDHVVNSRFIQLVEPNLEIKTFLTVNKALEWFASESKENIYDKLYCFLDIYLPVVDGFDFLNEFDNFDSSLRDKTELYMLSSSIDADDLARIEAHPSVTSFVSKPLSIDKLSGLLKD